MRIKLDEKATQLLSQLAVGVAVRVRRTMARTRASPRLWAERLECERIDLGKGKRLIAKQGRLNQKYQITVPEDLNGAV
jgi:hypothetical protein